MMDGVHVVVLVLMSAHLPDHGHAQLQELFCEVDYFSAFVDDPLTYQEALDLCVATGTHPYLAVVQSTCHRTTFDAHTFPGYKMWVNGMKPANSLYFKMTPSGGVSTYLPFTDADAAYGDELCQFMDEDVVSLGSCGVESGVTDYICQNVSPGTCPETDCSLTASVDLDDYCVFAGKVKENFGAAQARCGHYGAEMIPVYTESEREAIKNLPHIQAMIGNNVEFFLSILPDETKSSLRWSSSGELLRDGPDSPFIIAAEEVIPFNPSELGDMRVVWATATDTAKLVPSTYMARALCYKAIQDFSCDFDITSQYGMVIVSGVEARVECLPGFMMPPGTVSTFTCTCPDVTTITATVACIEMDECESTPCQHGGTCIDQLNDFYCVCPPTYRGQLCDEKVNMCDPDPCIHGDCDPGSDGDLCQCDPGFTGDRCQTDIDDCRDVDCENEGHCVDDINSYTCRCVTGYSGDRCEKVIDECESDPCQNGGTCRDMRAGYRCECERGYNGVHCEIDVCTQDPCDNGGTCDGGRLCSCPAGYSGDVCEVEDSSSSSSGGGGSAFGVGSVVIVAIVLLAVTGVVIMVVVCIAAVCGRDVFPSPAMSSTSALSTSDPYTHNWGQAFRANLRGPPCTPRLNLT